MNSVSLHTFDVHVSKTVTNHFLDIGVTSADDGAKACKVFA